MLAGFFIAPLSTVVEGEAGTFGAPTEFHVADEPFITTQDIPALDSELTVTRNGGVFLRLSDRFREILLREGSAAVSQDRIARKQETNIRPMYRFCEFLSVFDHCRLGEGRIKQWRVIDPSRLYRRQGNTCSPVISDAGAGEHVLRLQGKPVTMVMPNLIGTVEMEDGARAFNEVVQTALDNPHIDVISLAAQFHRGCCAYQGFDWQGSVFDLFSIVEVLANECWRRHVEGAESDEAIREPLTGRASKLADSWLRYQSGCGQWRPSVSDLLSACLQTQQMDDLLYRTLDSAREARNGWVHGQSRPSLEKLEEALDGAAGFIRKVVGVELKTPGGFNYGAFFD